MADKKKSQNESESEHPAGVNPQAVYIGGESLADRLVPHLKKIFVGIAVLAVLVTAIFTYKWYTKRERARATSQLVAALAELDAEVGAIPPATPDAPAPTPGYATHQARSEAALAQLRKAKGEPRTGAALLEAKLLFEAGQLDQAEAAYRKLAGKLNLEGAVAREGIGYVAEARGDLDAALAAFRAAQPEEDGPRREYALYHEGRILALQGKKDEARTVLEKALAKAEERQSDIQSLIQVRLTQLDAPPPKAPEKAPDKAPEKAPETTP